MSLRRRLGSVASRAPTYVKRAASLRVQLVAATLSSSVVLVSAVLLLHEPMLEVRETERLEQSLHAVAKHIAGGAKQGRSWHDIVDLWSARLGVRLSVFDAEGRWIVDSVLDASQREMQPRVLLPTFGREEHARSARRRTDEGPPQTQGPAPSRFQAGDREDTFLERYWDPIEARTTVALWTKGTRAATEGEHWIRITGRMHSMRWMRDAVRDILWVAGALSLLVAGLLIALLSRTMIAPVVDLTSAADALAAGDLSIRMDEQRQDELGVLARALNRMASRLQGDLRRYRTEEARLRAVLDAMADPVFVTNHRREIVLTNPALDACFGANLLGKTAIQAFSSVELRQAVRGARQGETRAVDVSMACGGKARHLIATVTPLPQRSGVVGVLHDITEVRRADKVRRDFVANASHELRTPLTAIRGFAETLQGGALKDPVASARFVDVIVRHTHRLQALVDDLFALSRAESQHEPPAIEPVELVQLAMAAAGGLEAQAEQKGVALSFGGVFARSAEEGGEGMVPLASQAEMWGYANERSLDEIAVNLLDNAIKYTPAGGSVRIGILSEAKRVAVFVEDTGPGISEAHRSRIFERFFRVDKGRSRDEGGTGLGLAIVKHLAGQMRAELELKSAVGKGSTFFVWMPSPPSA